VVRAGRWVKHKIPSVRVKLSRERKRDGAEEGWFFGSGAFREGADWKGKKTAKEGVKESRRRRRRESPVLTSAKSSGKVLMTVCRR